MVHVKLLARDNAKPGNKELVDFLKQYIDPLIVRGVTFDFKIVEESEIPNLVKKGLDKLPVAMVDQKIYSSSVEIKSMLLGYLGARSAPAPPRAKRDPMDEMREMYESEMSMEAAERDKQMDDDGGDRTKRDLMEKYNDERQRRDEESSKAKKPANKRSDNVDTDDQPPRRASTAAAPRKPTVVQQGPPRDKDDAMLMNMFEETD